MSDFVCPLCAEEVEDSDEYNKGVGCSRERNGAFEATNPVEIRVHKSCAKEAADDT